MHPLPNRNPLPFLYLFTHLLIPSRLNFRLPLLLHPPSTPLLCHYLSSSFHSPSPTLPYLSPSPLLHSDPILFPASPSLQLPISWSSTPNSNTCTLYISHRVLPQTSLLPATPLSKLSFIISLPSSPYLITFY